MKNIHISTYNRPNHNGRKDSPTLNIFYHPISY